MISEIGSTEYGGSKAAWIKDMLAKIPTDYPKIRGLLWFEKFDDGMDWPIETSASATSAFADRHPEPRLRGQQLRLPGRRPGHAPTALSQADLTNVRADLAVLKLRGQARRWLPA